MLTDWTVNIINEKTTVMEALQRINHISDNIPGRPLTLLVVDNNDKMVGTLTDGDLRRNLVKNGMIFNKPVSDFMFRNFTYLEQKNKNYLDIRPFYKKGIDLLPVLDDQMALTKVYNLNITKAILPVHAVIMAGGDGVRLRPLTNDTPKPMLKVGSKPIIERNVDRLVKYGIDNITISLRYLGEKISDYFGDGSSKGVKINYVKEENPLGTLGAVGLIEKFSHKYILLINSDILTTLDFSIFLKDFIDKQADMSVVTIPYYVKVPYGIMEADTFFNIKGLKEKPQYTYYCNGGIYLFRRELLKQIKPGTRIDVTDFMQTAIDTGKKVIIYPFRGYWLDIGSHEELINAQSAIKILEES
jgi:dTDP-glucose pyrophosphorylase